MSPPLVYASQDHSNYYSLRRISITALGIRILTLPQLQSVSVAFEVGAGRVKRDFSGDSGIDRRVKAAKVDNTTGPASPSGCAASYLSNWLPVPLYIQSIDSNAAIFSRISFSLSDHSPYRILFWLQSLRAMRQFPYDFSTKGILTTGWEGRGQHTTVESGGQQCSVIVSNYL